MKRGWPRSWVLGLLAGGACVAGVAAKSAPPPTGSQTAPEMGPEMGIVRLDPGLDALIAPGTRITRVATGFKFTEGPMWRGGRLWFSDVRGDGMRAVSPDGKVRLLIANSGGVAHPPPHVDVGSNAMVTDKDGSVLMIQQGARTIVRVDDRLKIHPFLSSYNGKRFNSPNDLVFAPDGSLWFTDPPFGLAGKDKDPDKQLPFNAVFRYANGKLTPEITDFTLPNGIGFSPDGHTLYVSNYGPKMYVKAFDVGPGGRLSRGRVLIAYPHPVGDGGPDGLKVDRAGNIWSSGPGGIRIITPAGKVLGQIKLPEVAANLAFTNGGRTVFITASSSIYRLEVKTPGEVPLYVRE
ncbi:MAG: SMP-30/gluconolactonase/LRE family protein [Caulobacteraceae bacterium]